MQEQSTYLGMATVTLAFPAESRSAQQAQVLAILTAPELIRGDTQRFMLTKLQAHASG